MKKYFRQDPPFFFLILLLLPLFYINVKDTHDWGDDFAQYFIQARNILEGRPQTDNGLVFDRQTGEYALKAYPVGFPLMIATAWKLFGESVLTGTVMMSFFFVGFGILSYCFFRKYFSGLISLLLTLVIIYNPFTVGFKREILSDIPFAFLVMAGVLLYLAHRKTVVHFVITGIVWGFALSVRGIGAALFVAAGFYLLQQILLLYNKKESRHEIALRIKKLLVITASSLTIYLILNAWLFPIPSGSILGFYADAMQGHNLLYWMKMNLGYYHEVFLNFFATMGGGFLWLSTFTKYLLLVLILPGILIAWNRKPGFDDWLFVVYMFVLLLYPYLGGGFRFLMPVLPFLLKYIFIAFSELIALMRSAWRMPVIGFLIIILLQYFPGIAAQVKSMKMPEEGPNEPLATEAFDQIRKLPENAIVVFLKPRALSFYAEKNAAYVARNIPAAELPALFQRLKAHYFLLCHQNEEVNDVLLKKFIRDHSQQVKLIWRNKNFELYSDL